MSKKPFYADSSALFAYPKSLFCLSENARFADSCILFLPTLTFFCRPRGGFFLCAKVFQMTAVPSVKEAIIPPAFAPARAKLSAREEGEAILPA